MGPAIWLAMARDELRAAELLAEHGMTPLSCLHADQAIEKALQALHVHRAEGEGEVEDGGRVPAQRVELLSALDPPSCRPHPRLAAALASLARRTARSRQGERAEPASAAEAVQIAQQLIERVTERVFSDE